MSDELDSRYTTPNEWRLGRKVATLEAQLKERTKEAEDYRGMFYDQQKQYEQQIAEQREAYDKLNKAYDNMRPTASHAKIIELNETIQRQQQEIAEQREQLEAVTKHPCHYHDGIIERQLQTIQQQQAEIKSLKGIIEMACDNDFDAAILKHIQQQQQEIERLKGKMMAEAKEWLEKHAKEIIEDLIAERDGLREALAFYANKDSYDRNIVSPKIMTTVYFDQGYIARSALNRKDWFEESLDDTVKKADKLEQWKQIRKEDADGK